MVVLAMLVMSTTAFAVSDKAVFELVSLGVVQGDENGELHVDEQITRAEFAKIMVNLLGYAELSGAGTQAFSDVPSNHFYAQAIGICANTGVFSGFPDGTFRPDDPVLLQDSIKTIVKAIGYEPVAAENGGYPGGYLNVAYMLNLTKDISASISAPATRGDVITLIYNALDKKILTNKYSNGEVSYEESTETLRTRLTQKDEILNVRGVVTANQSVWLVRPLSNMKAGEVEIDGVIYDQGNTNTAQYIGQEVEIYCREDAQTGKWTILNVAPTRNNQTMTISSRVYRSFSDNKINYEKDDSGRVDSITLSDTRLFIYNNRLITDFQDSDMEIENGSYLCIDNDGDEKYDYVFINAYESGVVDRVYENGNIYLKNEFLIDGKKYLALDEESDINFTIRDTEGNEIELKDVEEDDVISVFKSKDGYEISIICSKDKATGAITRTDDDGLWIGEEYYEYGNDGVSSKVKLGDEFSAYLNHEKKVVFLSDDIGSEKASKYGYILRVGSASGLGDYEVKMLDGALIQQEQEENENKDDKNTIPVLVCKNEQVRVLPLNDKLSVNGKNIQAGGLANRLQKYVPVEYKTDASGKVRTINILESDLGSTTSTMKFNAKELTFGGYETIQPFAVDENTQVICIPDDENATDDDLLTQIRIDNKDASVQYKAAGYEYDENSKAVKLLVIVQKMVADTLLNITENSKFGMVASAGEAIDEDGQMVYKTEILREDELQEYITRTIIPGSDGNEAITRLKKGDLIRYEINNDGYLSNAEIVKSFSGEIALKSEKTKNSVSITGYVTDISFNDINATKNMKVNTLSMLVDGKDASAELPARIQPAFYIYNRASKKVTAATIDDIRPFTGSGTTSDIVCVAGNDIKDPKACVIVR